MTILDISIDEDPKAVDRMVAEKKVPWAQVCDGKGRDGEIPTLFNVQGTPTLYLLSRDGKIAAKKLEKDQLEEKLRALLHPYA